MPHDLKGLGVRKAIMVSCKATFIQYLGTDDVFSNYVDIN